MKDNKQRNTSTLQEKTWYYEQDGEKHGPFLYSEIKSLKSEYVIRPSDRIFQRKRMHKQHEKKKIHLRIHTRRMWRDIIIISSSLIIIGVMVMALIYFINKI